MAKSKRLMTHKWRPATLAIHGPVKRRKAHHAVSTPIVHTSNYSFESTSEVYEFMKAKAEGRIIREHEYGRYFNPTRRRNASWPPSKAPSARSCSRAA